MQGDKGLVDGKEKSLFNVSNISKATLSFKNISLSKAALFI